MQNCADLCKTVQTVWLVARGWLAAGVRGGQWAVGTHLQLHLQSAGGETFTQPSPASGVWRNGVSQARQAGAAPNLGWTGHPHGGPRTPQGYGDSVTSSDHQQQRTRASTSNQISRTQKNSATSPPPAQHRLPSSHSRHVSKV